MNVGFIGLGIMGSRMAANLIRSGFRLRVHNRTQEKARGLAADWCESPANAARKADVLFTMLSTPEAVQETALGEGGFLPALVEGAVWVDSSTVHPSFSRHMAGQCRKRGIHFLDAPVAGSKGPAETGDLVFLVGGDAAVVERCAPLFEAMGKAHRHLGANGAGTSMKMVVNLLLGHAMAGFAEGLALGESLGISRSTLLEMLLGAPVTAPFLQAKRSKVENDAYEADFPLQWMHKDLHLAALTAYEQGLALPGLQAVKEIFAMARRRGWGEKDFSAVCRLLQETRR